MSDVFTMFNEVNLKLQGNDVNLINVESTITAFVSKLKLFKYNVARRELHQFPSLSDLEKEKSIPDDDLQVYFAHLDQFQNDMAERFHDGLSLRVPDWVINPFLDVDYEETGVAEEELLDIKNDIELRPKFKKSYKDFWLQNKIPDCYPVLWNRVKMLFVAFPTSHLVERGFSAVALLLSKQRNRLKITEHGLLLSAVVPNLFRAVTQNRYPEWVRYPNILKNQCITNSTLRWKLKQSLIYINHYIKSNGTQ